MRHGTLLALSIAVAIAPIPGSAFAVRQATPPTSTPRSPAIDPTAPAEAPDETPAEAPGETRDEAAAAIAAKVIRAVGGSSAFDAIRFLRFEVAIEAAGKVAAKRSVVWDKSRDLVRIDLETKGGAVRCAFSRRDSSFAVFEGERAVEGKEGEKVRGVVAKTFRADWNHLTLPFRLDAEGVIVKLDGEVAISGATCDRLAITFGKAAGALAGDRYWLVVDRETSLPRSLEMKWKAMGEKEPALRFDYAAWTDAGGVKLVSELKGNGNPQTIRFRGIQALEEVAADTFLGLGADK